VPVEVAMPVFHVLVKVPVVAVIEAVPPAVIAPVPPVVGIPLPTVMPVMPVPAVAPSPIVPVMAVVVNVAHVSITGIDDELEIPCLRVVRRAQEDRHTESGGGCQRKSFHCPLHLLRSECQVTGLPMNEALIADERNLNR
jgi:hypothetical protein